jgi:hypothetical protein
MPINSPINKQIISRTIGENDGISQVFIQNNVPKIFEPKVEPKFFNLPMFRLNGATYKYYEQTVEGISVNINNLKTLNYIYTANTLSFSAITKVIYDIYRVDFENYNIAFNNIDDDGSETALTGETEGLPKQIIQELTFNPLISLEQTGITSSLTTIQNSITLPTIVKPENEFAESLLLDKSQYFIDTRFEFIEERDKTLGGFKQLSANEIVDYELQNLNENEDFLLQTIGKSEIIREGKFKDIITKGALFTYFIAPQKPNIDVLGGEPSVRGILDTFTPIFSFNNVSDGDYYKLQVSYDLLDVTFSGAVVFDIPKQEGNADDIRVFSTPLSPDSSFIYRIGNTKEIINVFGVKQNVTTWGRFEEAYTATDGIFDISGTVFQNELFGSPVSGATVVFTVISTTADVELGVDAPFIGNIEESTFVPLGGGAGTSFSGITNASGQYFISGIKGGLLDVQVSQPLYETTSATVNITGSTSNQNLTIALKWGSSTLFGQVGGQLFV